MPSSSGGILPICLLLLAAASVSPTLATYAFKEGNQYVYSIESRTHTKEIGELTITGQFAIQVQSKDPDGSLHLLLALSKIHVRNGRGQTVEHSDDLQLDKWFTFQLGSDGRVSQVRYPHDETAFLATVKKGLVTALLGHDEEYAFHTTHEWNTKNRTIGRHHVEISKTRRGVAGRNVHRNLTHCGSVHDNRVFKNSDIYADLSNRTGIVLLGDEGYGITPFLMKPFRDPNTPEELHFNKQHAEARVVIENTFGQLKRRFPILKYMCRVRLDRVPAYIIACCVLHNVGKQLGDDAVDDEPAMEEMDAVPCLPNEANDAGDAHRRVAGMQRRRDIADIMFRRRNGYHV